MAAIDKLRVRSYHNREDLIIWCIEHNPSLLRNIYQPFNLSEDEWDKWQEEVDKQYNEQYTALPIASFSHKQDRYLYWRCPFDFVREYLRDNCGYKDNWFVKLFWKE